MAISWIENETRTVKWQLRTHDPLTGFQRDATPADLLSAIEANKELRTAVRNALNATRISGEWVTALEEELAITKARAERAEAERDDMAIFRDVVRQIHAVLDAPIAGIGSDHKVVHDVAVLRKERDEARGNPAEFDRVGRVIRAMAEWTPEARAGLVREIGARWKLGLLGDDGAGGTKS